MTAPTVVLVDDHALVSYSLTAALAAAGMNCVPIPPQQAEDLLPMIVDAKPELVLLDLDLGAFGDAGPIIAGLSDLDIKVLVLTGSANRIRQALALEQGAVGVVTKSAGFDDLVRAVQQVVVRGGMRSDPMARELLAELAAHRAQGAIARAPFDALTDREKETLVALAEGRTVQQIAASWVVSETTVRSHVQSILVKLDARSQLQAVVKAVHNGWIEPGLSAAADPMMVDSPRPKAADRRAG